jgi:prophage maintenance system killer protein
MAVFLILNGHNLSGDYAERAELIAHAVAMPGEQRGEAMAMLKLWLNEAVTPEKNGAN